MLTINEHKRGFLRDGKPFFWLGDTAWLLFKNLTDAEIETYLRNRAMKGFTVIQATLVHQNNYASPDGAKALIDDDFGRPDAASEYWNHVERAVRIAEGLGLVMALLPAWGCFAKDGSLNPGNAPVYAKFLADRVSAVTEKLGLKPGAAVFLSAGKKTAAQKTAGVIRKLLGNAVDAYMDKDKYEFCWIVDFPMYEIGEESGELEFCHNPFSMPQGGLQALTEKDPLDIYAWQYDLVCNGGS